MRAAVGDGVAGHEHRPARARQQVRRRLHRGLVTAQARRHPGRSHQVDIGVGTQDVAGERQEHRAGRRRQRRLGGAMHQPRQINQPVHLRRPLDQWPRQGRKVAPQDRLGGDEALLVLAGGDQDGGARLLRVVEHAHGVAEAGRDVKIDHRKLAGGLGVAVGHGHDRRLLQAEQIASSFSVAKASISGNSVVPGLPNMISTPSCLSRSRKARFPDITGKSVLPMLGSRPMPGERRGKR